MTYAKGSYPKPLHLYAEATRIMVSPGITQNKSAQNPNASPTLNVWNITRVVFSHIHLIQESSMTPAQKMTPVLTAPADFRITLVYSGLSI